MSDATLRFLVFGVERKPHDPVERLALLRFRLDALEYRQSLLDTGELAYAFIDEDERSVQMLEVASIERADWVLKRDPLFPYSKFQSIPTVTSDALVEEAQDYLGETLLDPSEMPTLVMPKRDIVPFGEYWLAWKEVPAFSPLVPKDAQDDVHRRTVIAQQAHVKPMEFADDNPIGQAVGVLVAEAPFDEVVEHVQSCEVFPDTDVVYKRLHTLAQAWRLAVDELRRAGRQIPEPKNPTWR